MSSTEKTSLVFKKSEFDLPSSKGGVINLVSDILTYPFIKRIVLDEDSATIKVAWYGAPTEKMLLDQPSFDVEKRLLRVTLEECSYGDSFKATVFNMLEDTHSNSLFPVAWIVSGKKAFKKLLSFPNSYRFNSNEKGEPLYFGIRIVEYSDIGDNLILLGASAPTRKLDLATHGLRASTGY